MKYNKLTFIETAGVNKDNRTLWKCLCDCGNEKVALGSQIKSGGTKSCGCLKRAGNVKTHGHRPRGKVTPTYAAWCNMRRRCRAVNEAAYVNYGGRGIDYCPRWDKFEAFLSDMGERKEGLSLDRIDNDGNYEPGNCRWATRKEQSLNKRSNVYIEYDGKNQTIKEWSDELGLKYMTLSSRIKRGWSYERALTT